MRAHGLHVFIEAAERMAQCGKGGLQCVLTVTRFCSELVIEWRPTLRLPFANAGTDTDTDTDTNTDTGKARSRARYLQVQRA